MTDAPLPPLDWAHAVTSIPNEALRVEREADAAECRRLADLNGLLFVDELKVGYDLRPLGKGRYAFEGRLRARLTQRCVVSLEPIGSRIDEPITLEFWPAEQIEQLETEHGAGARDGSAPASFPDVDTESIGPDGEMAVGMIIAEALTLAIPAYPRKPGAELRWQADTPAAAQAADRENPFAVLAKLVPKK